MRVSQSADPRIYLYKVTKAVDCSLDVDSDLSTLSLLSFTINILALHLFRLSIDYVFRTSIVKENGFTLKKDTMSDYTDDLALRANTPAEAESHFQSLEQAAGGISLNVNANKKEYMCFTKEPTPF